MASGSTSWTVFDNVRIVWDSQPAAPAGGTTTVDGALENLGTSTHDVIRKPVLAMPDVCMPTYWPVGNIVPGYGGDHTCNTDRMVDRQNADYTPKTGSGYVRYTDVLWDGFTVRNGFYYNYKASRDGGAGVRLFEGGTVQNCVVVDNANFGNSRTRGGGIYCDGKTANIINTFVIKNLNTSIAGDQDQYGGGMYMIVGTCYNSLFANNTVTSNENPQGGGLFIEDATFYNNTVAYNAILGRTAGTVKTEKSGGIHQYTGSTGHSSLNVFNTIFYKNTGWAINSASLSAMNAFKNCYVQSQTALSSGVLAKLSTAAGYDNIIHNASDDSNTYNPFEKQDAAPSENNYRLKSGSECINSGVIPVGMEETFPSSDVDFAQRVQDCRIDIGAYEYDGAYEIAPLVREINGEKYAIYYVTANGEASGNASADSPGNAACAMKLQKVLDAAGRYKYDVWQGSRTFSTDAVTIDSDVKHVVVKLGGNAVYRPTRTTQDNVVVSQVAGNAHSVEDNVPTHSLIVPHGVELWGGYDETHRTEYESGKFDFNEDYRNILANRTLISGSAENELTGAWGTCYHVITFTDNIYDTKQRIYRTSGQSYNEDDVTSVAGYGALADLPTLTGGDADRAVLDGLFLEEGAATGYGDDDRIGGACIVTDYAHVRNCVVQNNEAVDDGGGLHLRPGALVSGSIVQSNTAPYGGGIYAEEATDEVKTAMTAVRGDAFTRVYNSTVVYNTASTRGGGLWYDTNLRAKGLLLWKNTSNDMNNVSGTFDYEEEQNEENFPFSYCAVENLRMPGVNNISVAPESDKGVRWTKTNYYADGGKTDTTDIRWRGEPKDTTMTAIENKIKGYYYMHRLSQLVRSGMPYSTYDALRTKFPSLDLYDMAGTKRKEEDGNPRTVNGTNYIKKSNEFLEIGARALNQNMGITVEPTVMRRLFVMPPEDINTEKADAMQHQTASPIHQYVGSSMAQPFQRLNDAFDYIAAVRNSTALDDTGTPMNTKYPDVRFEVFIAAGTYYPNHNVEGQEGYSRGSTFVIPEGVTVIGGLAPHNVI